MFLISSFGVQVRGVATPNVLVGVLVFFGGICQFIAGIMEFISGNTVSLSDLRKPLTLTLFSVRCDVSVLSTVSSHELSTHNTPANWLTSCLQCLPLVRRVQSILRHDLPPRFWNSCCLY
jgi:hypothetical protein